MRGVQIASGSLYSSARTRRGQGKRGRDKKERTRVIPHPMYSNYRAVPPRSSGRLTTRNLLSGKGGPGIDVGYVHGGGELSFAIVWC